MPRTPTGLGVVAGPGGNAAGVRVGVGAGGGASPSVRVMIKDPMIKTPKIAPSRMRVSCWPARPIG